MSTKKHHDEILAGTSISLTEAMDRTNFFRQAAKPLFGNNTELVPKGFVIPFEDISALMAKFSDPSVVGVRAYFTLTQDDFTGGIRGVLVPVTAQYDETSNTVIYKDLIVTYSGDEATSSDTSIFDFTKPCPDACDNSSKLS